MLIQVCIFIVGLIVLSWSADRFIYGASALARNIGVSPMMIGLTIVAMGSSAPEIVVSATASMAGNHNTGIGNAIGSNITNIALVLGLTALFKPLSVSSGTVKRELPILLGITLIGCYFLSDSNFTQREGLILIIMFFAVIVGMAWISLSVEMGDPLISETEDEIPSDVPIGSAVMWVLAGLVLLPTSAHFMVESAVDIARYFGISDLVIGLTIIALGTSLPELAASIAGVVKGEHDLALGNVIGSNMFNLLAVLAMPGLIAPGILDPDIAQRDIYVMLGLTILLFLFSFNYSGARRITRFEGLVFVAAYMAYQYWLLMQ
ncbi:calcium/sodium antiporter [Aestuariibacter salexigens]|uniref:calcium/sodium antiporter n=1 Tax=Aestuariibacter salexigens TaxID=226010 RepID=UPI000406DF0B|nr:calcium/sodium antiporter [Aestuariibacter salexigens]